MRLVLIFFFYLLWTLYQLDIETAWLHGLLSSWNSLKVLKMALTESAYWRSACMDSNNLEGSGITDSLDFSRSLVSKVSPKSHHVSSSRLVSLCVSGSMISSCCVELPKTTPSSGQLSSPSSRSHRRVQDQRTWKAQAPSGHQD